MKARVSQGPGLHSLEEHPEPRLQAAGDAIVRMLETTVVGIDLHVLKGDAATRGAP